MRTFFPSIAATTILLGLGLAEASFAQETTTIALVGEQAPGGGTFFFLFEPRVNDDGDVVFRASVSAGDGGIFVAPSGGSPTAAVLEGDAAPGGGIFTLFNRPSINSNGDIAFIASISGSSVSSGVFLWSQGQVTAIATNLDAAPGTGGFFGTFVGSPWLNDSGEVAFRANVQNGSSALGIFVASASSARNVFRLGAVDPSQTGTFANFGDPSVNDASDVVVAALITEAGSGEIRSAVVGTSMGLPIAFALDGDPAPDTGGGDFSALFDPTAPAITNSGTTLFRALIDGASATSGVFAASTGPNDAALVLGGDALPDTNGGSVALVADYGGSSDAEEVAYAASVVNGSVSSGLFATGELATRTLALPGDAAPAPATGTFAGFLTAPAISPNGQIAFKSGLVGGTAGSGIFAILVPEPGAAPLAAVVFLSLLRLHRVRRN